MAHLALQARVMSEPKPNARVDVPPLARRLWNAARLRCPVCGGGGVLRGWMKLRERCPTCGLRMERGEHDFFLGAMMFNIALAEGILAIVLVGVMIALWPDVPWRLLEIGGPAMMVVTPFAFYPFSQLAWLAVDLLLHPLTHEELDWHRSSAEGETRRSDYRAG